MKKIPAELKTLRQWAAWRSSRHDAMPVCCKTGGPASSTDPRTWTDFESALSYAREHDLGLCFAFVQDGGLCGVDLDDCREPLKGRLEPWAEDLVRSLNSYAEVSPSGKGVRIFVRGLLPHGKNWNRNGSEAYDHDKFLTVTGAHLKGSPLTVEPRQAELDRLAKDEEILQKARSSKNRDKFVRLMAGDITGYQSDDSAADLALSGILAYHLRPNPDPVQLERLFARSKLARRRKWQNREDYRRRTIEQAIRGLSCEQGLERIEKEEKFRTHTGVPADGSVLDKAVKLAVELADSERTALDWQVMFTLARKLQALLAGKGSGGKPDDFEQAVISYCEKAGVPEDKHEDYVYTFIDCWHKVKLPEGENPNDWAIRMAGQFPVVDPPSPRMRIYALVGSAAYYLADLRKPEPFWFDAQRIAELTDRDDSIIYKIIQDLERRGVVRCVDRHYDPVKGECRKHVYTGPQNVRKAA